MNGALIGYAASAPGVLFRAPLDVEAAIDRLVRHLTVLVVRKQLFVLNAQHDRLGAYARLGLLPVRSPDVAPGRLDVAKKTVGRAGFARAIARIREAGRRVRRKSFHQNLRPLVEATIAPVLRTPDPPSAALSWSMHHPKIPAELCMTA